MKATSLFQELYDNFQLLELDAQEVLVILSRRLVKGGQTYGGMNVETDGRDYLFELGEELADTAVYHAMEFLKRYRRKQVAVPCAVCQTPDCKTHWEPEDK
jgi:hypothetical protein